MILRTGPTTSSHGTGWMTREVHPPLRPLMWFAQKAVSQSTGYDTALAEAVRDKDSSFVRSGRSSRC